MLKLQTLQLPVVGVVVILCLTSSSFANAASNTTEVATTATTVPASTTVTAAVPPERDAQDYLLVLGGSRAEWGKLLDGADNVTKLREALRSDLARRFFTTITFVNIIKMWIGSLNVQFTVSPGVDGTQINEGAFLATSKNDNSWLSSTSKLYSSVSSSRLEVSSTGYGNSSQTQPPKHIVCSDGCVGAVAGGGVVVFVVAALVLWAWRSHSKEQDELELKKIGVIPADDAIVEDENDDDNNVMVGGRGGGGDDDDAAAAAVEMHRREHGGGAFSAPRPVRP